MEMRYVYKVYRNNNDSEHVSGKLVEKDRGPRREPGQGGTVTAGL